MAGAGTETRTFGPPSREAIEALMPGDSIVSRLSLSKPGEELRNIGTVTIRRAFQSQTPHHRRVKFEIRPQAIHKGGLPFDLPSCEVDVYSVAGAVRAIDLTVGAVHWAAYTGSDEV